MEFKEIYRSHWQRVYRLCLGYVNDPDCATDIAQETFITVWQQLPKFRGESAVGTWIFRIASNKCLRQIETQRRMPKSPLPYQIEDIPTTEMEEKVKYLYRSISELPESDRLIISLELEDVKQAEIAEVVGITEANVRVKIHRIKAILTEKFKGYGR